MFSRFRFMQLLAGLLLCLMLPALVLAVPQIMSYQGKLNDKNGVPVTGSVTIVFSIYDVQTGGTALWTETQTVTVKSGIFSVELGSINPLAATLFDKDNLYLGIKVGADSEMAPRQRFTSGGYAFKSAPISSIQQYKASFTPAPIYKLHTRGGPITIGSVVVPAGEDWQIFSAWVWHSYGSWWVINSFGLKIEEVDKPFTYSGGSYTYYSSQGYTYQSGLNIFYSPQLIVSSGQTITFYGATSANNDSCSCDGCGCVSNTVDVGLYYLKVYK